MMKPIKNLTYYNFMRVVRLIEAKGYGFEEAKPIAHRIFEEYNPNGLSVLTMVDRIVPKVEFDKGCV